MMRGELENRWDWQCRSPESRTLAIVRGLWVVGCLCLAGCGTTVTPLSGPPGVPANKTVTTANAVPAPPATPFGNAAAVTPQEAVAASLVAATRTSPDSTSPDSASNASTAAASPLAVHRVVPPEAAQLTLESQRPGTDWPQFLGPQDTSVSTETGLNWKWPAAGPPVLWTRPLGEGYAAPSIRGERVVVQHRRRDREFVECLHAETGKTLWSTDYETNFVDPYGYNGGTRCSPLLTNDRAYTFGPQGLLLCTDLATGEVLWHRETAKEWKVPEHFFGAGCTPILEGGRLIVLVGGQPDAGVVALDPATGKTLWESVGKSTWNGVTPTEPRSRPYVWTGTESLVSYSTPVAATIHGQRLLLCLMRQGLVGLDPATGQVRFKHWFRSRTHESVNAARPIVIGDEILLSAAYEAGAVLLKVRPEGNGVDVVWRDPEGLATHWSTAVVVDGLIYGFSGRHEQEARLQCREWKTGTLRWETNGWERPLDDIAQDPTTGRLKDKQTGQPLPWPFFGRGSHLLADGHFVLLGERGTLALSRPDGQRYVELSRCSFPQVGYPSWAAPVLSRGRLFLRSEDHLVCLDVQSPKP